ncbi:bifunctional glycosyltransferase family 2/GtrA family protein [Amylibacter sp.]|nr:bifunctional glycosyltransferase family 2/GtrA family protein [Amylibacter sp.]
MNKTVQIIIPAYQPNIVLYDLVTEIITISDNTQKIDIRVIIVDDGSTKSEAIEVFEKIMLTYNKVVVINHEKNLGKGNALKTALRYIKENFNNPSWIVTADADGQHLADDIWAIVKAGTISNKPIIGVRMFNTDVPLRSKIGNSVTHLLFKIIHKNNISDTQSGLRGFHSNQIPSLLALDSKRYAFELDALIHFVKNSKLREIPITTVYEPGNPTSHFRPLLDSAAIYAVLFRQILSGFIAMVLEVLLFLSLSYLGMITAIALPIARLFSGVTLFLLSRNFVFNSNKKLFFQAFKYIILVILNLTVAVQIINFCTNNLHLNKLVGLFVSYVFLFSVNFLIQKYLIFDRSK